VVKLESSHHYGVTLNYNSLSMCGVQFGMFNWLVISSSKGVLKDRCTYNFCLRNSNFWRTCFWIDEVVCTSNMTEILLIFPWSLEPQEQSFPWVMDEAWQAQLASQISKLKTTRLLWMEMDEQNYLQHEVWNMRHTDVTFWTWHSVSGTVSAQVTTKQRDTVQLRAGFLKTRFKHRSV